MTDIIAYVPTRPRTGAERVEIEMLPVRGGGLALLAYTSIDELVRCFGTRQSWIGLDERGLAQVKAETKFSRMVIDQPIPDELRYQGSY